MNEILAQCATPEQREIFEASGLDSWLRDTGRDPAELPGVDERVGRLARPVHPPPRPRADAVRLGHRHVPNLPAQAGCASWIPQEPTINQRFGIVMHQVLERFHTEGGGSLERLRELFEISWRRSRLATRRRAAVPRARGRGARALLAPERRLRGRAGLVRAPVRFQDRPAPAARAGRPRDRHPDGSFELIDYKTGKAKTADELREDVQLSVYQMGARESWRLGPQPRATSTC